MKHALFQLLSRLDETKYAYTLSHHRADAIMVTISFIGERVEIEVFDDGHMEVSRFLGTEDILGGRELIFDMIEKKILEDEAYERKYKYGTDESNK
jgi:hypothetical protein